jgi:hypothetical protein
MTGPEHIADRPSWNCRACGDPWPCAPARKALIAELTMVGLAVYMWTNLEEAARDLSGEPFGEVYTRFLGWSRG